MRQILHSDMNNFYASVECLYNPSLREKPVVVAGDAEARHGIVLAKNEIAKRYDIKTGNALWQAKQLCPDVVFVDAHFDRYLKYSGLAREIYLEYTDQVEPFGLDECWLDVTGSTWLFGDGKMMADELRARVRNELGLTVSVGVSYNKVFAKLGSDMKKPDATTVITPDDLNSVWSLPVSDLLYVGPATTRKLHGYGIRTIGAMVEAGPAFLYQIFGKNGLMLYRFATGQDTTAVVPYYAVPAIKSIGNSTTAPRDLITEDEIKITMLALCESVAARLREQRCICDTLQISIRDNRLVSFGRQVKLDVSCACAAIFYESAMELYRKHRPGQPVRSLGVRAAGLTPAPDVVQLTFFPDMRRVQKLEALERTMDRIRSRYGYNSVRRGIMLQHPELDLDARLEHIIHPVGFLGAV